MSKKIIRDVSVRSALSGVLYAPDYDENGERVFRDKAGKRYPISAQADL